MANVITYGVTLDATGAINGFKRLDAAMATSGKSAEALESRAKALGVALGLSIASAVAIGVAGLRKMVRETSEAADAQAQLTAALKSTGGAAGQTMASLNEHARALQQTTRYSDDAVAAMQGILLTFNKVSGDTFPRATEAILDLATRMGGDLKGAALQVGKALQDPVTGLTALRRSGVSFSDAQEDVIKRLAETNRLAEAQAMILQELQVEFGGSANAARNTLGGALDYLKNQFNDLFELDTGKASSLVRVINVLGEAVGRLGVALDGLNDIATRLRLIKPIGDQPGGAHGPLTITTARDRAQFGISSLPAVTITAMASAAVEVVKRLAAMPGGSFAANGVARPNLGGGFQGTFANGAGITGSSVVRSGQEIAAEWASNMAAANEQIARNFRENVQGSIGGFFSDFLSTGRASVASLFQGFRQLAADVLGQIAAKSILGGIGGKGGGGLLGGLGGLLSGPLGIGLGVLGIGAAIFGGRSRGPSYRANNTPTYSPGGTDPRQIAAREALAGSADGLARANEIRQSVGGTLTETSASRIVGNLESIRVGIFQLVALAQAGALGGNQVTVNASGTTSSGLASDAASAINRMLGGQVQQLRLNAGVAVLP